MENICCELFWGIVTTQSMYVRECGVGRGWRGWYREGPRRLPDSGWDPAVGTCGVFQPAMWISTGYNFQEQPVDISVKTLIEGPGLYHLGESETLSFGFQRVTIYWNNQLIFRSKPLTRLSNGWSIFGDTALGGRKGICRFQQVQASGVFVSGNHVQWGKNPKFFTNGQDGGGWRLPLLAENIMHFILPSWPDDQLVG